MGRRAREVGDRACRSVTLKDVARYAGVSPMTVSRVVNGREYASDLTRKTVMRAVSHLGYSPNLAARSLAGARTERLAILYADPSPAYLNELLVGALEATNRHAVTLVLEKCEPTIEASRLAIRRLLDGGVMGVALPPPLCESPPILAGLKAVGLRFVAVGASRPPEDVSCVGIDDFAAARDMTRYLLELGHRRLGFIKGHPGQTASNERWRGFAAAVQEHRDLPPPTVAQGFFTFRSGLDAARKLLSGASSPTAIFASNDEMAAAVIAEAHHRGLDIPNDLTVVGFDDSPIAVNIWPGLTTVRQPLVQMAAEAVDILVRDLRAGCRKANQGPNHLRIGHELVRRESAAQLKAAVA